jgi:hypothetical protein
MLNDCHKNNISIGRNLLYKNLYLKNTEHNLLHKTLYLKNIGRNLRLPQFPLVWTRSGLEPNRVFEKYCNQFALGVPGRVCQIMPVQIFRDKCKHLNCKLYIENCKFELGPDECGWLIWVNPDMPFRLTDPVRTSENRP